MGYEINWTTSPGDSVLEHPYYQKFSEMSFGTIDPNEVKGAIGACLANRDSSGIVSYLCWLLRCQSLIA